MAGTENTGKGKNERLAATGSSSAKLQGWNLDDPRSGVGQGVEIIAERGTSGNIFLGPNGTQKKESLLQLQICAKFPPSKSFPPGVGGTASVRVIPCRYKRPGR